MSQLINNTLSAWSIIEALNPATIEKPSDKLSKEIFLNNKSQAKYQNAEKYEFIWTEKKFKINIDEKWKERRFKYLRMSFRMNEIDKNLKKIFNDQSEIHNVSRTLCYSYHFEVSDKGQYIDGTLYVPMIMSALKSLKADRNADINKLYQDAFEKFEAEFNKILADETVDNGKVDELDEAFKKYFYHFEFDSTDGYFKNYIEVEHIDPKYQMSAMNSFYISDIEKAKSNINETLKKYIKGITDSERITVDENREYLEEVLTPNEYPDGRWPSLIEHKLSLMQQAAVNQITGNNQVISSVNGPPGTGKTTLLKDIFAHYVVERAKNIAALDTPWAAFQSRKIHETDRYDTHFLQPSLTKFKMVVTSSNNGAVENISKDLPKYSEVIRNKPEESEFPDYEKAYLKSAEKLSDFQGLASKLIDEPAWGLFSGVFGRSSNITEIVKSLVHDSETNDDIPLNKLLFKLKDEMNVKKEWGTIKAEFEDELQAVKAEKQKLSKVAALYKKVKSNERQANELEKEIQDIRNKKREAVQKKEDLDYRLGDLDLRIQQQAEVVNNLKNSRGFIEKLIVKFKGETDEVLSAQNNYNDFVSEKNNISSELIKIVKNLQDQLRREEKAENKFRTYSIDRNQLKESVRAHSGLVIPTDDFWSEENYDKRQESVLWVSDKLQYHRGQLFLKAMNLHKIILIANASKVQSVLYDFKRRFEYINSSPERVENAWNVIHMIFPIISTTFASFGTMYKTMPKDFIDYLFVDEAGQAIPQAATGAMYRSKQAIVVGDPIQIEPVVTLDKNLMDTIRKVYNIPERLLSMESSVQSLADNANKFGFYKGEENNLQWIGTPLWVHRRCLNPMFSIANEIAYENKMVLPSFVKSNEVKGKTGVSQWLDSSGTAVEKQYVKEHGEIIFDLIIEDWNTAFKNNEEEPNVYVISPFSAVKDSIKSQLKSELESSFTESNVDFSKWIETSVGTVHTFQGKEADKVYFVVGTDDNQNGAAQWSCSKPNLLNVAVTRAKKEFYIIGDKKRLSQMQYYDVIDRLVQK